MWRAFLQILSDMGWITKIYLDFQEEDLNLLAKVLLINKL